MSQKKVPPAGVGPITPQAFRTWLSRPTPSTSKETGSPDAVPVPDTKNLFYFQGYFEHHSFTEPTTLTEKERSGIRAAIYRHADTFGLNKLPNFKSIKDLVHLGPSPGRMPVVMTVIEFATDEITQVAETVSDLRRDGTKYVVEAGTVVIHGHPFVGALIERPPQLPDMLPISLALENHCNPLLAMSIRWHGIGRAQLVAYDWMQEFKLKHSLHRNSVDLDRILQGQDCRTTIMLKNIPKIVSQAMLLAWLQFVCFGMFDFFYLRIDFRTGYNVGYCFINLSRPIYILKFALATQFIPWDPAKEPEILYATCQGRETLVQKFRNSNVMQQDLSCRPRLFSCDWFSLGAEEPFPAPDNASKLQRSIDNARTVGLYNRHNRPEGYHRSRIGIFDFGTMHARNEQLRYMAMRNFQFLRRLTDSGRRG